MDQTDNINTISKKTYAEKPCTRLWSLRGLSGILAGIYAIVGGIIAYNLLKGYGQGYGSFGDMLPLGILEIILIGVGGIVAILTIGTTTILTKRKAKKNNELVWSPASKPFFSALFIPIITGAIFILLLTYRGYYGIIVPSMLIFYGMGLINASKYNSKNARILGLLEILLGIIAMASFKNGILFWILGFGVLHILYGSLKYFNPGKKQT
ncbi:hypothetical protein MWU59_02185 [Flavobacteriaceae bacterium F08102]|nr:hypothetical protein [Flavobacteriaceae bacterium F08102]